MIGPETCDVAAKALIDIRDAADLILLDLVEGRDPASAAIRFAAIQQYAARAIEYLEEANDAGKRGPAEPCVEYLRAQYGPSRKAPQGAAVDPNRPNRRSQRFA